MAEFMGPQMAWLFPQNVKGNVILKEILQIALMKLISFIS